MPLQSPGPAMPTDPLCLETATNLTRLIHAGEVSCVEVLNAHLAQVEQFNPALNAIVTLVPDKALAAARQLDRRIAAGDWPGSLAGIPVAHKDLTPTAGIRTTFGSPRFADHVPTEDALVVTRLKNAGAVTIGKTNTPEWGAGSQTFNTLFGATANPYDLTRTCGGSSGGAATALAARMVPLADGSDMGGSLRNPASFCNVVGLRVSPGRVPTLPAPMGWFTLGVTGPMARTVEDCALMLSAIAGPDGRCPISIPEDPGKFAGHLERDFTGTRIAFSSSFGDQVPVARSVRTVIETAVPVLESIGITLADACPDFGSADSIFKVLRAWSFAAAHAEALQAQPAMYKDSIHWNVGEGLKLSGMDLALAEQARTRLFLEVQAFMQVHEFLVLPVAQVTPFDIHTEWVREIEGEQMHTYIDWMKSCYFISVLGLPAISVPCGFTPDGLPVGLQIVGRHQADLEVLRLAYAFQQATGHWQQLPGILQVQ